MAREHKKNILLPVLSVIMFFVFVITIFVGVLTAKKPEEAGPKALPVVKISLLNTTLAEVHENGKDIKYDGNNLEIFDNGITNSYDNVEFKGRGNFSWSADKRSYRIKFDERVDLFGMGKKRKWALIANSMDDSLMRNDVAYFMSDLTGGEYEMEGRFVELVVNGEELGVYYLMKTMEIDKQAVGLKESDGVLVEMDNAYCEAEERSWTAKNGDCLTVEDVVTEDWTEEVMAGFLREYNKMVNAVANKDFEALDEVADVESFARYFLISELSANPDAYVTSWYFYRDGLGDKIHAGPVWDFDSAFGNRNWGDWPEKFYDPETILGRFEYTYKKKKGSTGVCGYDKRKTLKTTVELSFLMCEMLELPEFREVVSKVYMEKFQDKKDLILEHLEETYAKIREAALRNAEKWGGDFDAEFIYLADWVSARFEMFEKGIGSSLFTAGAAPAANVGNAPTKAD